MTRFTAIVKWNDEWFSNLKPIEKLVFLYLTDRCDNAGFFEINKRIDAFLIGITEQEFIDNLKVVRKSYVASKDGKKVWLKNYIKYQKNLPLNPENNAHKQIINILKSNQENFEYDFNILGANKGLISPIGNSNSKGNSKGKVEEGGLGETKSSDYICYDLEDFILKDQLVFEKICMATGKKPEEVKPEIHKYHLWMTKNEKYPVGKKAVEAGAESWILNKKNFSNGFNSNQGSTQSSGSGISGTSVIPSDKQYKR